MKTTQFRSLRNFWLPGRGTCRAGEILELDDNQARELVALGDTVEPVHAKDRRRVITGPPRVQWESPAATRERVADEERRLRVIGTLAA